MASRKRPAPSIVHPPVAPRPADLYTTIRAARVWNVPLQFVMGDDMYANWRRRTKRLHRARIGADHGRRAAIDAALRRLTTGRAA